MQGRGQTLDRRGLTLTIEGIAREILGEVMVGAVHSPDHHLKFNAIWDTGASGTVVSPRLVGLLDLKSIGPSRNYTAGEIRNVNRYLVNLVLSDSLKFSGVEVIDLPLPQPPEHPGFDLLIGMDIITMGDLTISNYQGDTCMSFQIPSMGRTDYVKQINFSKNNRRR